MEVKHLIDLISELTPNSPCKYVRGEDVCTFVKIDAEEQRLYTKTPQNEDFSFAQSYITELAGKIKENVPFNTSQLLNNKGSNRAVIDSIIAHTREFYWLKIDRSKYTVWIPSLPHNPGELIEIKDTSVLAKMSFVKTGLTNVSLQQIFYGAPGTGKSHEIKKNTKGKSVIRTTFHPDSDYSTFVGCYKPFVGTGRVYGAQGPLTENGKPIEEPKITYRYVMQAFLKAYLGAWKKYADRNDEICEPQFLVIEEINRGNCAQIFGDLFQLLDRDENGFSEYPIEADTDLQLEIERAFKEEKEYKLINDIDVEGVVENYTSNYDSTLSEDVQHGRVLLLPKNLYIWATMNTSDQSLFPIDSAFKRRWDWEYMPIGYKNDNWTIEIGEKKYKWVDFQHKINEKIYDVDNSEDKQLGDYFVNADRTGNKISAETILNKILFYLWNDVCKDDPDQIFKWVDDGDNKEKSIKFSEFFCGEDERNRKLQGFMAFLKVIAIGESQARTSEPSQSTEEAETNDATAEIMK